MALGRNVLVAFMPWGGYNFEDSILISERVVKEDLFTSVHIEEFECIARDTKLGQEEITRDIPNVGEEALRNLDTSGIIRIGAEVRPGDILVGKITPKGETQLSPKRSCCGRLSAKKAGEVRDTSLRVPPGVEGTVINARVFSRRGVAKDDRTQEIQHTEAERLKLDETEEVRIIRPADLAQAQEGAGRQRAGGPLRAEDRRILLNKGHPLTADDLDQLATPLGAVRGRKRSRRPRSGAGAGGDGRECQGGQPALRHQNGSAEGRRRVAAGVIKMIKVFVAIKRRLQVGDKMAGRHGNKGVLSRILPEEDMPYLEDGIPVDIVLNPLGVPSRMNVGQILETHLGWAARELGALIRARFAQFGAAGATAQAAARNPCGQGESGVHRIAVRRRRAQARGQERYRNSSGLAGFRRGAGRGNLPDAQAGGPADSGQCTLYDGRNGLSFEQPVTVGVMYMMKLHHLVEDKIHARSTGPYSLVTQQPLGGKAQFGGQRLGEMEVWALEAYGAAYALQEMLTVKSDDVAGRTRMYEAIVKGENTLEPGLPESFNVMVKELQSLCLNVDLLEEAGRA